MYLTTAPKHADSDNVLLGKIAQALSSGPSGSGFATTAYVDTAIANLIDSAPGVLDTLNEIAAALNDNPNFATSVVLRNGSLAMTGALNAAGFVLQNGVELPGFFLISDAGSNILASYKFATSEWNFSGTIIGTLSGNASTASKFATARTINGVSFDGSANITVTAAAGTLSGSTLAAGVTASSLTSVAAGCTVGGVAIATVDSHSTLTYAATTDIDFTSTDNFRTVTLTGNITFTTSNRAAARSRTIRIVGDGSQRTLTFPAWKFVGSAAPATLAANKIAILTLTAFGANDTDIVAAYAAEP